MSSKYEKYCENLRKWAELKKKQVREVAEDTPDLEHNFIDSLNEVALAIDKSCLLDRMMNGNEQPSKTPCPVHKGRWSGYHFGWPGSVGIDMNGNEITLEISEQCQKWYDQSCRCFQHSCGCTTGWQPDEHCGCLKKEKQ